MIFKSYHGYIMGYTVSKEDLEFIKKINKYPELKARFANILEIAQSECTGCRMADQANGKVVDSLKELGREVLQSWADTIDKQK